MLRSIKRILFLCVAAALAGSFFAAPARAGDYKITATLGLGGLYRPGAWLPVNVHVVNTGPDTVHGQVQILANPDAAHGGPGVSVTSSVFTRPVTIASGQAAPQSFTVYARGLNPSRDDLVAQLADGSERGDGRVLAQATSGASNANASAFTGVPLSEQDVFLVAISADPAAFTFLNGQKMGLSHAPDGAISASAQALTPGRFNRGMPANASLQVASPVAADLPDRPAGYDGVDAVLVRSDMPLASMTEAQTDALKAWIASGGHLVICGNANPGQFSAPFFAGLLPKANPRQPGAIGLFGKGTITQGAYGAGTVVLSSFDPTAKHYQSHDSALQSAVWGTLLTGWRSQSSSLLSHVAVREENASPNYGYGWGGVMLSDAVMRAPSLDAPPTGIIGFFLLAYVLILVPINYLVLKRLDRKEWAWVTIPVLVLLFAVGTYGVGYAAKGGALFLNRAAIVETTAGQRQAGVYADLGLFSPRRTNYDLSLADPNALSAIPNAREDDYAARYQRRSSNLENSYGQTRFVQAGQGAALQDVSVNMWAMRAFDVQTTTDLGGAVDATLINTSFYSGVSSTSPASSSMNGTIANHTGHVLSECALLYNGQWQSLGDLAPGAVKPVSSWGGFNGSAQHFQIPTLSGRIDKDDPQSDVSQRMKAALAEFARSLGDGSNSNGYYGNNGPPPVYQPRQNEAILIGWSREPTLAGPSPRVDGRAVRENDVSLVVVHLPISTPAH